MKDLLINNEVKYEIHCRAKKSRQWGVLEIVGDTEYDSVQEARRVIVSLKQNPLLKSEYVYRIVKLTIKKEVVK
jgi:hypothetical protein